MKILALVVIAIAIVAIALKFIKKSGGGGSNKWPFYPRKPLSAVEQILYFRLTKALPDHIVLAQVQLSRLLGVKKGNNYSAWANRINRMSADFVVCTKDSTVLAVIELDDSSHNKKNRQEADSKKDKALSDAGVKIHRWNVKAIPDEATIKTTLIPAPAIKTD
jgi:very-short-patch-repair endonuclease